MTDEKAAEPTYDEIRAEAGEAPEAPKGKSNKLS